jgi:transcriptional regulator with PAS, ATPase and Fis domain
LPSSFEHDIVEEVIRKHGGNQSAAARQLGISRTTLWRMMKDQGER